MYNRGEACALHLPNVSTFITQNNVSKIALIEQSFNCYLVDKIMNAERDGATAAIIFNNSTSPDQQTMVIYKKNGMWAKILTQIIILTGCDASICQYSCLLHKA